MLTRLGFGSFLVLSLAWSCTSSDDGALPDASYVFIDATPNDIKDAGPVVDAFVVPLPDARPSALACAGDPLPTVIAAPPVVIGGPINEASAFGGLTAMTQSAHVAAHAVTDDSVIAEGDFVGAFSLAGPNDPTPVDAYLKATSSSPDAFVDSYVFAPAPISESQNNTPIIMVPPSVYDLLPVFTVAPQTAGNGVLIVIAVDCNQTSMEGAVVSTTPVVGSPHYANAGGIPGQAGDFPATQSPGITYFVNLPPGTYTVDATAPNGTDLRTASARVFADSMSTVVIAP